MGGTHYLPKPQTLNPKPIHPQGEEVPHSLSIVKSFLSLSLTLSLSLSSVGPN
jgi:hypothetical protein